MDFDTWYEKLHARHWDADSVGQLLEAVGGDDNAVSTFVWKCVAEDRRMAHGIATAFLYPQQATTEQMWALLSKRKGVFATYDAVKTAVERDFEVARAIQEPDSLVPLISLALAELGEGPWDFELLAMKYCQTPKEWWPRFAASLNEPEVRKSFWAAFPNAYLSNTPSFEAIAPALAEASNIDSETSFEIPAKLNTQIGTMPDDSLQVLLAFAEASGYQRLLDQLKTEDKFASQGVLTALLFHRAGLPIPDSLDEHLQYSTATGGLHAEVFAALAVDRALAILPAISATSDVSSVALGHGIQDDAPLLRAIKAAHGVKKLWEIEAYAGGLSAYGTVVVAALATELQNKLPQPTACAFVDALHLIGDPESAGCLVEAALMSQAKVRARACRALEALDEGAVGALQVIISGRSKARARKAQLILSQLPHRLLTLENPLGTLMRRAQELDPRFRTSCYEAARTQTLKIRPLLGAHGALMVAILRPVLLKSYLPKPPGTVSGAPVGDWQKLILELGDNEEAVWTLIDTFARFHPPTHSKANHEWVDVWSPMVGDKKLGFSWLSNPPPGLNPKYARPALDWVLANVHSLHQKELKAWRALLGSEDS